MTATQLPSVPQLVRFRARLEKAMDGLESASNWALDALRAFDGDKVPVKHPCATAWEAAHSAEMAIPVLKGAIASALTDIDEQVKLLRGSRTTTPEERSEPHEKP
jgi:hypothetical protein